MQRVINGLRYDTNADDLEEIGTHNWDGNDFKTFATFHAEDHDPDSFGSSNRHGWTEATLYRTASGRFFMTGRSLYETEPGDRLVTLTDSQALDFCENYLAVSDYEDAFVGQIAAA